MINNNLAGQSKIVGQASVARVVLSTLGVAGILSIALIAPNALKMLELFPGWKKYRRHGYIENTITKLRQKGLIACKTSGGKTFATLTPRGKQELAKFELGDKKLIKPARWDKKWRIIIFDIKEWKRNHRDQLRAQLADWGLVKLQKSVWVTPYDCEELIFLLKTAFGLGRDVVHITAEKIENDKQLRRAFNLN